MINVKPLELKLIQDILTKHVPGCEVRAFGSRVTGYCKRYSDIDLVVIAQEKVDIKTMFGIQEAFEDSILPFRVDIVDWHRLSEGFQQVINNNYEVIQEKTDVSRHSCLN